MQLIDKLKMKNLLGTTFKLSVEPFGYGRIAMWFYVMLCMSCLDVIPPTAKKAKVESKYKVVAV